MKMRLTPASRRDFSPGGNGIRPGKKVPSRPERPRARVDSATRRRPAHAPAAYRARAGESATYRFTWGELDDLVGCVAARRQTTRRTRT
jgi:hypothetical protein